MKTFYFLFISLLLNLPCSAQWTELETGVDTSYFSSIYAITPDVVVVVGTNGVILKTTDGGETWQQKDSGLTSTLLKVEFPTSSIGYIASSGGELLKTTDGGETWHLLDIELNSPLLSCINENILFVKTNAGLVKSVDGGENWAVSGSYPANSYWFYNDTYQFLNENIAFAGSYLWESEDWNNPEFFKTTDGGQTWQPLPGTAPFHFIDENLGYYYLGGLYKTEDGGNNFEKLYEREYGDYFSLSHFKAVSENTFWGIVYLSLLDYDVSTRAIIKITSEDGGNFIEETLWDNDPEIDMKSLHFPNETIGYIAGRKHGKAMIWKNGTGVNKFEVVATREVDLHSFKVYPNPASSEINIEFQTTAPQDRFITISDLSSKQLFHKEYKTQNKITVNVGNFPKGIYILSVRTQQKSYQKKILIR